MSEMNIKTPNSMHLHIGIFGKRNAGKSTLINAISNQSVSIVDDTPGTTTDVVTKAMELKPLGPVLLIDTAGIDDHGLLGNKRVEKSLSTIDRIDLAVLVIVGKLDQPDIKLLDEFKKRKVPVILALNKSDVIEYHQHQLAALQHYSPYVSTLSARDDRGLDHLKMQLVLAAPKSFFDQSTILSDLVGPGDLVVMVVPIDLEAPKGRLIMPQVQVLRELLDCDAKALVVKERELADALQELKRLPKLVITDSQAILKVMADVPDTIPVTGFSVLFARWKGDLTILLQGVNQLDHLKSGDRILMLEACSHHPIEDDIGRVKIPRWIRQYTGCQLKFDHYAGQDLPTNFADYQMIVHCGSCVANRQQMLSRIMRAQEAKVPITNYGLIIAKSLGVLQRMLSPFPSLEVKTK